MLADSLWRALHLEPATLEGRSAFFLKYVESLTQALDPDLDEIIRRAEVEHTSEGEQLTWLEEFYDGNDEDLDAVVSDLPRREPRGFDLAIRADALREAALATLAVNVQEGRRLLQRSGDAYVAADMPYGLFLRALADPAGGASTRAALTLMRAWPPPPRYDKALRADRHAGESERERPEDRVHPALDSIAAAARDPAQQLYLVLATRQDAELDREYRELFDRFAQQPHAQSPVAVGSTGISLDQWWSLVSELTSLVDAEDQIRANLEMRLRDFASEHGRQLARAQGTVQWHDARAAVDIVDLDIAGATCVAVRRMQSIGMTPFTKDDFDDIEPLAMVSLSVGLDMAREADEPIAAARNSTLSLS
jgi:hypothetical protein